ncbi:MAG TPA: hypothetical protein QF753_09140 [Victivallales bacterium]|nr:hypothetical protein [Victivallales bacterium]
MKLTPQIQQAITSYLNEEKITAKELSNRLNISETSVGRWLNGRIYSIAPDSWAKLEPLIKKYIKPVPKNNYQLPTEIQLLISSIQKLKPNEKLKALDHIIDKLLK